MKKSISATIDEKLIKWIEKETNDTKKYRNKSHLIEIALDNLKKENEGSSNIKHQKKSSSG